MRNITKFDAEVITDFHPLFKGLLWVSVARSTDDTRYVLTHIHVEREGLKTHIVATDGKRVHVHTFDPGLFDGDITPIEPGNYEVIVRAGKKLVITPASDEELSFPNWRALLPTGHLAFFREVVTRASVGRIGIRSGVLLATDFALEACGFGHGFGKDESVHIEFASEGSGRPMVIRHELGKAIVMPMKLDDEKSTFGTGAEPTSDTDATPVIDGLKNALQPGEAITVSVDGVAIAEVFYDSATDDEDDDGPRIVDAEPHGRGWSADMLEETLVEGLQQATTAARFAFFEDVFADGTAGPLLKSILDDPRTSKLFKQQAMRAAIRGDVTDQLRDSLVCPGAKAAMRRLEKAGGVKAITAEAKGLIALLVPKDLAELDLLLEGGCVLPLGVRNLIRKATDDALADSVIDVSKQEGAEADY